MSLCLWSGRSGWFHSIAGAWCCPLQAGSSLGSRNGGRWMNEVHVWSSCRDPAAMRGAVLCICLGQVAALKTVRKITPVCFRSERERLGKVSTHTSAANSWGSWNIKQQIVVTTQGRCWTAAVRHVILWLQQQRCIWLGHGAPGWFHQ